MGVKSITFTGGGEPLMAPTIEHMIEDAYAAGFKIGLVTNGVKLRQILDLTNLFEFIRVSLDAGDAETYAAVRGVDFFDVVVDAIETVMEKNPPKTIGISCIINERNRGKLDAVRDLGLDLGVDYVRFTPRIGFDFHDVFGFDGNAIYTERFRASFISCKLAGLVGVIGADGRYYFCCVHRGEAEFEVADLTATPIAVALERRTKMEPDASKCSYCRYANYEETYVKYIDARRFAYLRHKEFL